MSGGGDLYSTINCITVPKQLKFMKLSINTKFINLKRKRKIITKPAKVTKVNFESISAKVIEIIRLTKDIQAV